MTGRNAWRESVPSDVAVVVVTFNSTAWLERCLESVRAYETVVVDHGSTDGTVDLVRSRFPSMRLIEQENRGLAAGWNRGIGETDSRYVFLLNADAWVVRDALDRLVAFADDHPDAAVVGPKLLNQDGTLQRSVRGFPTPWRIATEYLFLRKLAPRSRVLNAFYAGGFDHDDVLEAEFLMGAALLVRRAAVEEIGPADESFFVFSEETEWCYRFVRAGWKVVFFPGAEVVHVGGASHGGRLFREQVKGHLRFLAKHRGAREAERARRVMLAALRLRGALFRGERGRMYRDAARMLASGSAAKLLE
jgi:GT2 family glycosyltransferase